MDNSKYLDAVMPMYNLIEYSNNYSKTSGRLWQYYRDEPNYTLKDFKSLKSKIKLTWKNSDNSNTKGVEIAVPLY